MLIPTRAPRPRTRHLAQPVRRHQPGAYFGLTFAISWAIWLGFIMASLGIRTSMGTVLNIGAIAGPSIAALILAAALGRGQLKELAARLAPSRLSMRWSLIALTLPLAVVAAAITGSVALLGTPGPRITLSVAAVLLLEFVRVLVLGGPLGEELGWRGFALPRLQRHRTGSAGAASLLNVLITRTVAVLVAGPYSHASLASAPPVRRAATP